MSEFWGALVDPDVAFLRYAFVAGLLASVPFGVIGTYVVARRISYIAGAIAHCALGGIGTAIYLQYRFGWQEYDFLPLCGALAQALLAAAIIGLVTLYSEEREDTVIGAVWAVGMAQGLLFIAKTPGYVDPMSYLFGGIVYVSRGDLLVIGAITIVVVALALFFYNKLVAVCFDEEFARLRGVRVEAYYLMLVGLTAVTVVLLVRVVGIVMVIALLTLPAAVAGHFSRRIGHMMVVAVVCCMLFSSAGLAVSYTYELPSGPTIILIGGMAYLLAVGGARCVRRRRSIPRTSRRS